MKIQIVLTVVLLLVSVAPAGTQQPLQLDPENPHYFLFRGQPTVLIGSSEHYGSVLNRDFNYVHYLNTVQAEGLNVTRIFVGPYREIENNAQVGNTLAPKPDRFLAPWPRTHKPGEADGGHEFDLSKWNEAYFRRLKDVVQAASQRGIVVEVTLFTPYYADQMWDLSPLNAHNNVNGIGNVSTRDALSLKDSRLLAVEDALVRKVVSELRGFDNIYYEICNEPFDHVLGVPLEWQAHIAATIADAESSFPARHLIAQELDPCTPDGVGRRAEKVQNPIPQASFFVEHNLLKPDMVTLNYDLGKPLGYNENGFAGIADAPYRIEAWEYLMAGGAVAMGLDYSFTAGHEDGSFRLPPQEIGGASSTLRQQLRILHTFMNGMDFLKMAPAPSVIKAGVPEKGAAYVLAEAGKSYAVYLDRADPLDTTPRQSTLTLNLPSGSYVATWMSTMTGTVEKKENLTDTRDSQTITSPAYAEDIALRIVRASGS